MPATGEIVISNLVNRGSVLLNYRLGDVVTLTTIPNAPNRKSHNVLSWRRIPVE